MSCGAVDRLKATSVSIENAPSERDPVVGQLRIAHRVSEELAGARSRFCRPERRLFADKR